MIHGKIFSEWKMSDFDIIMVSKGKAVFKIHGDKTKFLERLNKITQVIEPIFIDVTNSDILNTVSRYNSSTVPLLLSAYRCKNKILQLSIIKDRIAPLIIFTQI